MNKKSPEIFAHFTPFKYEKSVMNCVMYNRLEEKNRIKDNFYISSRHHSVLSGTRIFFGELNSKLQISFGTSTHSSWGFKLGTNFVTSLQLFIGWMSQDSFKGCQRFFLNGTVYNLNPGLETVLTLHNWLGCSNSEL